MLRRWHTLSLSCSREVWMDRKIFSPHLKGSFRCALCTVFTASRRTVYKTCSLIWNANSARKLEAWCWGVHRLARFNVQNLRKYDKSMEFLRFGSKIHLLFFFSSESFVWMEDHSMDGELLQILLQAEKKAQGNAEKLLPDTPRKEEIKEENVLRQKEINILGQWQQASYCWIRFDPWTIFFHSILYIEVLYHFVSLYMKVCHTSFISSCSLNRLPYQDISWSPRWVIDLCQESSTKAPEEEAVEDQPSDPWDGHILVTFWNGELGWKEVKIHASQPFFQCIRMLCYVVIQIHIILSYLYIYIYICWLLAKPLWSFSFHSHCLEFGMDSIRYWCLSAG